MACDSTKNYRKCKNMSRQPPHLQQWWGVDSRWGSRCVCCTLGWRACSRRRAAAGPDTGRTEPTAGPHSGAAGSGGDATLPPGRRERNHISLKMYNQVEGNVTKQKKLKLYDFIHKNQLNKMTSLMCGLLPQLQCKWKWWWGVPCRRGCVVRKAAGSRSAGTGRELCRATKPRGRNLAHLKTDSRHINTQNRLNCIANCILPSHSHHKHQLVVSSRALAGRVAGRTGAGQEVTRWPPLAALVSPVRPSPTRATPDRVLTAASPYSGMDTAGLGWTPAG